MTIYKETSGPAGESYTAGIGFFDGVHRGHRFLIDRIRSTAAASGTRSAVVTFTNHPRALLHPEEPLRLINTAAEKVANLAATGLDACFMLDFTLAVRRLSAEAFIRDVLARRFHIATLLIGYDHRFGYDRAEGFADYVRHGRAHGVEVLPAPALDDGTGLHYSSSAVRRALEAGDVAQAAVLLGQPYRLAGTVIDGHHLGRTLGFPTANLCPTHPEKIIPAGGVYAVSATLPDGTVRPAMLNIGTRPTVADGEPQETLEAHVIGFEGNLYGQSLTLSFVQRLRDESKQPSLAALRAQLTCDRRAALAALGQSDTQV